MTGPELRAAIDALRMTRADLARLCGVRWGTVHRWCLPDDHFGRLSVPQYVVTIIDLCRRLHSARSA